MKILITSATSFEIEPILSQLQQPPVPGKVPTSTYHWAGLEIDVLVTGVGLISTAWSLGQHLTTRKFDLLLQVGIAGALDRSIKLTEVVEVVSETFADLGVEEADGSFTDMMSLELIDPNGFPFKEGRLWNNEDINRSFLRTAHGISVNKVHGFQDSIDKLTQKYPFAQVESMEGGAFFFAALHAQTPFLQIRAISNYVETRKRENWKIKEAISNLNKILLEILSALATQNSQ